MSLNIDYDATLKAAQARVVRLKAMEEMIDEFGMREKQLGSIIRYFNELAVKLEDLDTEAKAMLGMTFVGDVLALRQHLKALNTGIYQQSSNYGGVALVSRALSGWQRIKSKEND